MAVRDRTYRRTLRTTRGLLPSEQDGAAGVAPEEVTAADVRIRTAVGRNRDSRRQRGRRQRGARVGSDPGLTPSCDRVAARGRQILQPLETKAGLPTLAR